MSNNSLHVATTSPTRRKNGAIFLLRVSMGSWWNCFFFARVRVLAKLPFSPFIVCFDKELVSDVIDNKETVSDLTLDSSIAF